MSKFDVWRFRVSPVTRATRSFTTPGGQEFSLTLERGDVTHIYMGLEQGNRLYNTYVTGTENPHGQPRDFPPVGGRRVRLSRTMCQEAAGIAAHQPADLPDSDRWTPEEIIALMIQCGPLWTAEVSPWITATIGGSEAAEADLGNASPAQGERSSSRLAPETVSIQNLPSDGMPSSGPSTSDSENCSDAEEPLQMKATDREFVQHFEEQSQRVRIPTMRPNLG